MFGKAIGWTNGERLARWAMVIDHGKILYAEKEPARDVTVCLLSLNKQYDAIANDEAGIKRRSRFGQALKVATTS